MPGCIAQSGLFFFEPFQVSHFFISEEAENLQRNSDDPLNQQDLCQL